ncbi:MAG TPA: energy transducer TonB [Polyangiaceae bacterium]
MATENGKNGAAGAPVPAFSVSVAYDDPMDKVLGLDAKTSGIGAWFGFTSGGTLVAAALMTLASVVAWWHTAHAKTLDTTQDIDVVTEPPPPPPPPPPEPEPEAKPAAPQPRAFHEAPPPPPPAQAAKVLTQEPKPDEPVDLTGNTIVQGNADSYAGGFTTANGSSSAAVRTTPSPTGVQGGTGPVNAPPQVAAPDLSRPASIGAWSCSDFPEEADTAQVDEAYVMIQVDVDASGKASSVRVLQDPGNGFGRQAKLCAMRQRFQPALDRAGNAIAGATRAFRVHFSR